MTDETQRAYARQVKLNAYLDPEHFSLDLYFYHESYSGDRYRAMPVFFEPIEGMAGRVEPTLRIDQDRAQQIMDALWSTGLRPRDVGTAGQLGATERHLEDMRAIAFNKLEIKR